VPSICKRQGFTAALAENVAGAASPSLTNHSIYSALFFQGLSMSQAEMSENADSSRLAAMGAPGSYPHRGSVSEKLVAIDS